MLWLRAWPVLALLLVLRPGLAFAQDTEGARALLSDVARVVAAAAVAAWF